MTNHLSFPPIFGAIQNIKHVKINNVCLPSNTSFLGLYKKYCYHFVGQKRSCHIILLNHRQAFFFLLVCFVSMWNRHFNQQRIPKSYCLLKHQTKIYKIKAAMSGQVIDFPWGPLFTNSKKTVYLYRDQRSPFAHSHEVADWV